MKTLKNLNKIRRQIIQKIKNLILYGDLVFSITASAIIPFQAMGLLLLPSKDLTLIKMKSSINSYKQQEMYEIISQSPQSINFTEDEIRQLIDFSIQYQNKSLSREELKNKIKDLRGGSLREWLEAAAIISLVIILSKNSALGFSHSTPPHMEWFHNDAKNKCRNPHGGQKLLPQCSVIANILMGNLQVILLSRPM